MLSIQYPKANGGFEGVNPKEFTQVNGELGVALRLGYPNVKEFRQAADLARGRQETIESSEQWLKAVNALSTQRTETRTRLQDTTKSS